MTSIINSRNVKEELEWEMLQLVDDEHNITDDEREMITNTLRWIRDAGSECEFWSNGECLIDRDSIIFKAICNYLIVKYE